MMKLVWIGVAMVLIGTMVLTGWQHTTATPIDWSRPTLRTPPPPPWARPAYSCFVWTGDRFEWGGCPWEVR